jgi:uncharacterized metal-binding protein
LADKDPRCARCETHVCSDGDDCFGHADEHLSLYQDGDGPDGPAGTDRTLPDGLKRMHRAATAIEGRHYSRETRLGELILFAKEMGYSRLGLAFCVGLTEEASAIERILAREFDVVSVCCKAGGIDKRSLEYEQIDDGRFEAICNSAGQADLLNRAGTDLNIICGLCVGHDAVFTARSDAPVTTLIAKDRVLAHNPAAAVWCRYVRRTFDKDDT